MATDRISFWAPEQPPETPPPAVRQPTVRVGRPEGQRSFAARRPLWAARNELARSSPAAPVVSAAAAKRRERFAPASAELALVQPSASELPARWSPAVPPALSRADSRQ